MKYAHLSTFGTAMTLTLATLSAGQALAADPGMPKTRAEVLQELEEAKRTGDIPANDESGLKLNEEFPQRYPPQETRPGNTREQVRKELEQAQRMGRMPTVPSD
jgi:predicted RNase H-like HicB family nuclease